jgi:hypothetical protein
MTRFDPRWRVCLFVLMAVGLFVTAGCRKGRLANSVTGKVSFNNGSVPYGKVQFYDGENKMVGEGSIQNGTYTVAGLPTGDMKVCVLMTKPEMPGGMKGMPGMPGGMPGMPGGMQGNMPGGMQMPPGMENMKPGEDGKMPAGMTPPKMGVMPARAVDSAGNRSQTPETTPDPTGHLPSSAEINATMDKITKKYGDPRSTDLSYTVQSGQQEYNITLTMP